MTSIAIMSEAAFAQQTIYWKKDHIHDGNGIEIVTATPQPSDLSAPTVPTGLNYSNLTATSVVLSWSASTDSGGSFLAGYKVYRGSLPVGRLRRPVLQTIRWNPIRATPIPS